MAIKLKPGDVLSYSSGSHNRGPHGFRVVREGGGILGVLNRKWPSVLAPIAGRTPIVINGYPANIGRYDFGVLVDSYLSLSTGSRALHLAHLENMPVLLLGQPLYVADLLFRHLSSNAVMPDTLIIGTGGYVMPKSLQTALTDLLAQHCKHVAAVHGYGVAEVDAGCLVGVDRNADAQVVYYPRDNFVGVDFEGEKLFLSLKNAAGEILMDRFDTGDFGKATDDGGFLIWNNDRLHPNVLKILESWSPEEWAQRTGYLYYGRELRFQVRRGKTPKGQIEADFHDYAKRYGHSWLFKPEWGRAKDAGMTDPLRRTIM